MITSIKHYLKHEGRYLAAAFFIPVAIMFFMYLSLNIYWGSERSVLASDAFSQFANFHASFRNVMHGEQSLFYNWNASLGLNYLALVSYYLGGIFTPLVFFFDNSAMPDALYLLTLLKIGCASVAFWVYAKNTFKLPRWTFVSLSVAYSLMSFITAHSELIMWLDIFLYLPLIILGINRLMDDRKPVTLFVTYLLLFVSNFYFGFMIGVFSVLYFLARLTTQFSRYKRTILPYFTTSLLAGCASMIMILPAVMDLRANGETLTEITQLKTEATAFWDILIKNMIGVFDTTKYGSIPFIYVGLLPLTFCLFFFVTKKIPVKQKLAFGSLFVILIASFYLEPLNLFWHGMHAPNMFLFRYSFLFSFLVIMLAGYGWEKLEPADGGYLAGVFAVLTVLMTLAKFIPDKKSYTFVTIDLYVATIVFLLVYLLVIMFYQLQKLPRKRLAVLLLILMSGEAMLNTNKMLNGILDDWNYASRSLFSAPYKDYKQLVTQADKANGTEFFRLESLAPISSNDAFNYGFSGISMFSSIRNRHSSSVMNDLGFRSRGTNLNIRYQNNTLLMDAFTGIRHNISDQEILKYGFEQIGSQGKYKLFQNSNALPLGMLTDSSIAELNFPENDNLGAQTALFNQLAGSNETYFTFATPTVIKTSNTTMTHVAENEIKLVEKKPNLAKEVTWEVTVPAGKQAYLSLFPTNFGQLESSTAEVMVNGTAYKTQIGITGQYYNLGYTETETTVVFTVSFYGTKEINLVDPPVLLLDVNAFQRSVDAIQANGLAFSVDGRTATAAVDIDQPQTLLTTIPYDKGWRAYLDGKQITTTAFKDGLLMLDLPKGTHELKLVFLPSGLIAGIVCFVAGTGGFVLFALYCRKKRQLD